MELGSGVLRLRICTMSAPSGPGSILKTCIGMLETVVRSGTFFLLQSPLDERVGCGAFSGSISPMSGFSPNRSSMSSSTVLGSRDIWGWGIGGSTGLDGGGLDRM